MTVRNTIRKGVLATMLAVAASIGLGAGVAHAEPFHTSYMTKSWTPWTSTTSQGPQYWTIPANSSVSMRCWTTGVNREGTAKWFRVQSNRYPFTQGYVPATVVGNQWTTSPHC